MLHGERRKYSTLQVEKVPIICSFLPPSYDFLLARVKQNIESMKDFEREFEQMVRANRGTIYTVCYMFSNDQDEVADLFQEVLINLWKSLPSREERGDVRSWIYRVSLNVCISLDRKERDTRPLSAK